MPVQKQQQQSSLDGFFGVAKKKVKGEKTQSNLKSFFGANSKAIKDVSAELQEENGKSLVEYKKDEGSVTAAITETNVTALIDTTTALKASINCQTIQSVSSEIMKPKNGSTLCDTDEEDGDDVLFKAKRPGSQKSKVGTKKRRIIADDEDEEEASRNVLPTNKEKPAEAIVTAQHNMSSEDQLPESLSKSRTRFASRARKDAKYVEKPASKTLPTSLTANSQTDKPAKSGSELSGNDNEVLPLVKARSKDAKVSYDKIDSENNDLKSNKSISLINKINSNVDMKKITEENCDEDYASENDRSELQSAPPKKSSLSKTTQGSDKVKSDSYLLDEVKSLWSSGDLPYSLLCEAFSQIEAITGRLQIQEIMTSLFRQVILINPMSLYHVLYLCSNSVAPAYKCVELGIGDAILIKAICEATGTSSQMIKERYEKEGDLGIVAYMCKSKQRTLGGFFAAKTTSAAGIKSSAKSLKVSEVLSTFREIALTKGNQSQKWKVDRIKKLLVHAATGIETKYIVRGLQGKLRIGLAQSTVLIALAHALAHTTPFTVKDDLDESKKSAKDYPAEVQQYLDKSATREKRLEGAVSIVKRAYSEVPSYDAILDAAFKVPLKDIHKVCTLTPGIPVVPMLAKPTKSILEVLKRLNGLKFTCEYKYDGERAQIHLLSNGTTKVFSRNLLDTSEKYPEVPLFVKEACTNTQSFVLDAEVVAYNTKTGQLIPFQVLSTRKKTEESAETAKVQVIVQAFDLMYLNGQSLLNRTLADRRQLLREHFQVIPDKFKFAESLDLEENGDTIAIEEFLEAAKKGQCEGLMVKTLDLNANYEPSRRSLNWLKLKKDYLEGLGDSVDLVPLGAYHGRGKRTGFYGAYLLACYDADSEEFQSVCKIGTGFSDEDLKTLSETLNNHIIPSKSRQYNVSNQLECDVWFDATQVWEVKAADLSKSSAHRGAEGKLGEEGRGIGLRFPRFERLRDDKRPEEATTSEQILEMYYAQDTVVGGDDNEEDDGI